MAATTTLLATTNSTHGPTYGVSSRVKPYLVEQTIDFSDQNIDANGSTIECVDIPANCICMFAGIEVTTALTNTASDATVDLGPKSGDTDAWVDGFDIDGASDGAYAPSVTVSADLVITSADTLDLTLAGSGASFSAGKIRVYAVLQDVSDIGEMEADEVGRDQLA